MRKYLKSTKSFKAYVTTDNTYIRTGPATTFARLDSLPRGTKVTSLTSGSNWNYVRLSSGATGYINKNYLTKKYIAPPTATPSPAPTFAPTPTPAPFAAYDAYITSPNGGPVNIRNGAGTGYGVIRRLTVGTQVRVVEEVNSKWSRIRMSDNAFGFVQSQYLTTRNPYPSTRTAWIKAEEGKKINVRNGAGSSYGVVFKLYAGTKVTANVDASTKNWVLITYKSYQGYVQAKYITYQDPEIDGGGLVETPGPSSAYPYTAYITSPNTSPVNVRVGPGSGYALAGSLQLGDQITVTGKTGKWFHIKKNSLKGYVNEKYVTTSNTTPAPTTTPAGEPVGKTMTVTTPNGEPVNMRRGPGLGYSNVTRVENGERVTMLSESGQWAYVYYKKLYGYINLSFLK